MWRERDSANLKQRLVKPEKKARKTTAAPLKALDDVISIVTSQQDTNEFDSSYTNDAGDDGDDIITPIDRTVLNTAATTKQDLSTTDASQRDYEKVTVQKIHALERKVAFLLFFLGIEDLPHNDKVEVQIQGEATR